MAVLSFLLSIPQAYMEIVQLLHYGIAAFFDSFWSMLSLSVYGLVFAIVPMYIVRGHDQQVWPNDYLSHNAVTNLKTRSSFTF